MHTSHRFATGIFFLAALSPTWIVVSEPIIGHWLTQKPDAHIQIDETVQANLGGWQTSDLTFDPHTRIWWSIGDQNCRERVEFFRNGESHRGRYAYRIILSQGEPQAEAIPISWKDPDFHVVDSSFDHTGTGLIDFEGIAADPTRRNMFFACTEGPKPWLVEMEYDQAKQTIFVTRSVHVSVEGNHDVDSSGKSINGDSNRRWEGISVSPDGQSLFLATEWVSSPARIYRVSVQDFRRDEWQKRSGEWVPPSVFPQPFVSNSIEGELSGLCFVKRSGRTYLLALERNTPANPNLLPSVYLIDVASPHATPSRTFLDLRAPAVDGRRSGVRIKSASPEGIATDGEGRIVLISDPDANFYKALESGANTTKLGNLVPLVFELRTADIFK
jgi:uncharacterized protein YjiK